MKLKEFSLITLLTLLSPLIFGYYFGVLDHDHYLPYLNKLLNPYLYLNDYYFSQPHFSYSPFNYFVVAISKITHLNLAWTHLLIYLFSLWLLYLSIYMLVKTLYKKSSIATTAVILFLLPKWAAQIGYMTHHFYFVSRDLSLGLSLLALNFILTKNSKVSALLLLLAALVNPLIPVPVGLLWLVTLSTNLNFVVLFNPQWMTILKKRGIYSFPHLWKWTGWGNLGLFLSLLATSWLALKQKIFGNYLKLIKQFLFICTGLFIFHLFITAIIPVPSLVQLQLLRSLNYILIISLIAFSAALNSLWHKSSFLVQLTAISALISIYLWNDHLTGWHFLGILILPILLVLKPKLKNKSINLPSLSLFVLILVFTHLLVKLFILKPQVNLPYYIYYPNPLINLDKYQNSFDLQTWAKNNTNVNDVFLVPPNLPGFRSFSERSIVADLKDGGVIFYSPEYAQTWQQRINDLTNYQQFNSSDFYSLLKTYSFNYLVVSNQHQSLDMIQVYSNPGFKVYKM